MSDGRSRDPNLSESEIRRLGELERELRASDPELDHTLRTGRREQRQLDPLRAASTALIATPLILVAALLGGPLLGTAVAAVSALVLAVRLVLSRCSDLDGPSAYR